MGLDGERGMGELRGLRVERAGLRSLICWGFSGRSEVMVGIRGRPWIGKWRKRWMKVGDGR